MIFGEMRTDEAEGAILAHSLRLPDRMFKKGRVLAAADLAVLEAAGIRSVMATRLEAGDIGEDEAAGRIGQALAGGPEVTVAPPFTGRCNLVAAGRGLMIIDRERLDLVNGIDEAVTVGTVAPWEPVEARQVVATVKIIPLAMDRRILDACLAVIQSGGPIMRLAPFQTLAVGLVQTTLPGTKASVLDNTVEVVAGRLGVLGGSLLGELRCPHDEGAVERAITSLLARGARMVLVAGASATLDRRDVVPAGIVRAGGAIDHFGMPVDPGNLLLLAHIGAVPVIDMPGCGRSPKLNGLDLVLRRLFAGHSVKSADIMAMGLGGLLKAVTFRPPPEDLSQADELAYFPRPKREARIAAVVLAAGMARRMGTNKLLTPVDGKAMVLHVVDAALAARVDRVVVVVGHQDHLLRAALGDRPVVVVANPNHAEGLSSSLKMGIAALPDSMDAALVCLGDMPLVTADHLNRLVAAFDPEEARTICVPVHHGQRGNPVLLGRPMFPPVMALSGDTGARQLIKEFAELVCEVAIEGDAVLVDVDTPAALAQLAERGPQ